MFSVNISSYLLTITGIARDAKKIGQKKRLRTLKDLDRSVVALAKACEQLLNEDTAIDQLRETIYV